MDKKRFERRIMAGLLVLLCVETTLLVLHLTWGGFRPHHSDQPTTLAGEVTTSEHELRRRSLNSLVWEKSSSHDPIYYYDSILTLSQSTAQLKLYRDTDLRLSENTLVTIEPPSQDRHGEIRLRFQKGGFKARNPLIATQVKSDSWSMEIKVGSEVDLRQAGEDNYELQVSKGEVAFKSDQGEQRLKQNELLRIDPKSVQQIEVLPEESLHWVDPPPGRIYTHKNEILTTLHWQGVHPTQLVRQTLGGQESVTALADNATEAAVHLPLGHHVLYLRNEKQTSKALEVEVWTAPLIHLVSPLPRDRVKTDETVSFVWTWRPEVAHFHFHLQGERLDLNKKTDDNTLSMTFDREDDAKWSVEAEDQDGYSIPAPYSYPIFIRETPLAAPKLKSPVLRKPAQEDKGAGFWQKLESWMLPEAKAAEVDDDFQAVFSWEPVERADRYVIEISPTPDFRSPIVTQTLDKNEFTWRHVELNTYYWRVAAESKRGQMGFFSEPEKVDLRDVHSENVKVTSLKKHVKAEPEKPAPAPTPAPVAQIPPTPPPPPPAPAAPPPPRPPPIDHDEYRIEWRPRYSLMQTHASNEVNADLQGLNSVDIGAHADLRVSRSRSLRLDFEYASMKYQPSPKSDYPLQSDLSWIDVRAGAVLHIDSELWGYGLTARTVTQLQRQSYAILKTSTGALLGPTLESWSRFGSWEYVGDYSVWIGSGYGAGVEQHLRKAIGNHWSLGVIVTGDGLFQSGGVTTSLGAQFSLGFQF